MGDSALKAQARNMGLELVRDNPEAVLLLRHTRITFTAMQQAVNAIAKGAKLIVSNNDKIHPGHNGNIIPETGALLAAIMTAFLMQSQK